MSYMKPYCMKHRPDLPIGYTHNLTDNTVEFRATVTLNVLNDDVARAVMTLRGFPKGMPPSEYPSEAACETASPGIAEAQRNCRRTLVLPCIIAVDASGNRRVKLV